MEHGELMTRAAAWMQARGWKRALAKKRGCEHASRALFGVEVKQENESDGKGCKILG